MDNVSKTIFDALASGGGINLPGIGSLHVEHCPAEFEDGTTLRPPYNRVIFSQSENPAYPSAGAVEGYSEWVGNFAPDSEAIEISGVGVLRGGVFYPAVELHDIINPQGTVPVEVQRRRLPRDKFLIGASVVAVIAIVLAIVVIVNSSLDSGIGSDSRYAAESESAVVVVESVQEPEQAVAEPARTSEVAAEPAVEVAEPVKAQPAARSATDMRYHLVIGVFTDPDNVDKLIASDPFGIGSENYITFAFGAGNTLVSAFASDDRAAVDKRRRELSSIDDELWIYQRK